MECNMRVKGGVNVAETSRVIQLKLAHARSCRTSLKLQKRNGWIFRPENVCNKRICNNGSNFVNVIHWFWLTVKKKIKYVSWVERDKAWPLLLLNRPLLLSSKLLPPLNRLHLLKTFPQPPQSSRMPRLSAHMVQCSWNKATHVPFVHQGSEKIQERLQVFKASPFSGVSSF